MNSSIFRHFLNSPTKRVVVSLWLCHVNLINLGKMSVLLRILGLFKQFPDALISYWAVFPSTYLYIDLLPTYSNVSTREELCWSEIKWNMCLMFLCTVCSRLFFQHVKCDHCFNREACLNKVFFLYVCLMFLILANIVNCMYSYHRMTVIQLKVDNLTFNSSVFLMFWVFPLFVFLNVKSKIVFLVESVSTYCLWTCNRIRLEIFRPKKLIKNHTSLIKIVQWMMWTAEGGSNSQSDSTFTSQILMQGEF